MECIYGTRGVWYDPKRALKILKHFSGVITPDFSTYQDFPVPLKTFATYRMRVWGYWAGKNGLSVINNVRWGTSETYEYCFDGIPTNSMVCIGTVGGNFKNSFPGRPISKSKFYNFGGIKNE